MPDWQFTYSDESIISTAYAYYLAKDYEAGNRELRIYAENLIDEIEWYNSLEGQQEFYNQVYNDKIDNMRIVLRIYQTALQNNQKEFCDELELRWKDVDTYSLREYLLARQGMDK